MCDRAGFFGEKNPSGKNAQKWPKNMVLGLFLGLFKKIMSLVLSGVLHNERG